MPRWSPFDRDADRRLVRRLNGGDEDTLTALYDLYAERLYDYSLSLVCDMKAAADIVHDCLIDASRRAPRMRDREQLRPWLYGAARRRCLQRGRSGGLHWEWTTQATANTQPTRTGGTGDDEALDEPSGDPHDESIGVDASAGEYESARERESADGEEPAGDVGAGGDDGAGGEDGPGDKPDAGYDLPLDDQRELVEATLARLDFVEQEALLLALRHDLTGSDLAVTLQVSTRRAISRVSRARSRAATAVTAQLRALSRRCAGEKRLSTRALEAAEAGLELAGHTTGTEHEPLEPVIEAAAKSSGATRDAHSPQCPACLRRDRVTVTELMNLAPAAHPPAALRRRVVHTATDPELAGYRAEIAGRGGNLTTHGMPRQPDVPSPFTRRWLFAGGGVAGALATAIIAVAIIGPDLPGPDIYWPSGPRHKPSISPIPQTPAHRSPAPQAGPTTPAPINVGPQTEHQKPPRPALPIQIQPGRLGVGPRAVRLASGERVAHVTLSASHGPVTWNAVPSTSQISVSREQGTIPKGGSAQLTIVLDRKVVELQGEATVTVTNAGNRPQTVTITWDGSVFT